MEVGISPGVAVLFDKKTSGETLSVTEGAAWHVMSGLGHGEGRLITTCACAAVATRSKTPLSMSTISI